MPEQGKESMNNKKYGLSVLPIFEDDLNKIIDHIAKKLNNPAAAESLLVSIEKAVEKRLDCPKAFEAFYVSKNSKTPYYQLRVNNYTIFYIVVDDKMELHRIMYNKRNWKTMLQPL